MKKWIAIAMTLLLVASMLVGCGQAESDSFRLDGENAMPEFEEEGYGYLAEAPSADNAALTENNAAVASNRKLIRTLNLTLETETYDELLDGITHRVGACGGYIESLDADTRYDSSSRYANMTIRVPVDKLEAFVGEVTEISNVVSRSETTEDVTLSYVDMESHRDALKIEQERLLALLETADNLTDILEIESRLTDVRYELEYMESQLRTYDNLIEYATVHLDLQEVKVLTPTDEKEKGFWEEIGDGFVNSLESVWEFLKDLFAFLVIALPYLLLLAVFVGVNLLIILLIVRACKKKARKRAEKAKSESEEKKE